MCNVPGPPAEDAPTYAKLVRLVKDRPGAYARLIKPRTEVEVMPMINDSHHTVDLCLRVPLKPPPVPPGVDPLPLDISSAAVAKTQDDAIPPHLYDHVAAKLLSDLAHMVRPLEDTARHFLKIGLQSLVEGVRNYAHEFEKQSCTALRRARAMLAGIHNGNGLYGATVFAFGSSTSGLALADSDVDLAIRLPRVDDAPPPDSKETYKHSCARLLCAVAELAPRFELENLEVIPTAKVPVFKYYDPEAKLQVDLIVADGSSILQSRLLRRHFAHDARVWELCVVVKSWAKDKRLVSTRDGYINSTGWAIMVIFYLQHVANPPVAALFRCSGDDPHVATIEKVPWASSARSAPSKATLDSLTCGFFEFFGFDADFQTEAISLNLKRRTTREGLLKQNYGNWAVFIEQPLKFGENLVGHLTAARLDETRSALRDTHRKCAGLGDLFGHMPAVTGL